MAPPGGEKPETPPPLRVAKPATDLTWFSPGIGWLGLPQSIAGRAQDGKICPLAGGWVGVFGRENRRMLTIALDGGMFSRHGGATGGRDRKKSNSERAEGETKVNGGR